MANLRVDKITSTETFDKTGSVQFGNDNALKISANSGFDLTSNDFTMEAWVYLASVESFQTLLMYTVDGTEDDTSFQFDITSTQLRFVGYVSNSSVVKGTNFSFESSTWYHVAATRTNDLIRLFVDGNLIGTHGFTSTIDTEGSAELNIGYRNNNGTMDREVLGHLSNVRIVNGVALYTSNFKPSMKELEVVPGTVLLACQSKTDASLEKTGKTITVNGTAVASELTPGILTPVVKSGGGSAITGSVEFDGTGDYLTPPGSTDFTLGTGDFTIECWVYPTRYGGIFQFFDSSILDDSTSGPSIGIDVNDDSWAIRYGASSTLDTTTIAKLGEWYHVAYVRNSSVTKLYLNGQEIGSVSDSTDYSANYPVIGGWYNSDYYHKGFISNFRVVKGTALYTDDFIPPTRELKRVPGTVLLCCQDSNDPTQEVTGKTISLNGIYTYNTVVTSGITTAPAPSNFTPQVGDDRQITFEGVTKINSDAYFYLPTGDTASREATGTYNAGTRGVALGGDAASPNPDTIIDYITIASTGNAIDFGDLAINDSLNGDAVADHTRGVCLGGRSNVPTPNGRTNAIQFVTISSTGNSQDFGDLVGMKYGMAGFSDSTRGISAGGGVDPNSTANIDYITISSKGNGQDFGDCINTITYSAGFSSPTRGIKAGGGVTPGSGAENNSIEYVTIQTTGNGQDFGDLVTAAWRLAGCSNAVRGVILEGETPAGDGRNAISYVTISTMGNAQDFGDATTAGQHSNGTSSSTRGVFMGRQGASPYANLTFIDFVHIMTTANAQDFGDLTIGRQGVNACSNGHGGLG